MMYQPHIIRNKKTKELISLVFSNKKPRVWFWNEAIPISTEEVKKFIMIFNELSDIILNKELEPSLIRVRCEVDRKPVDFKSVEDELLIWK